MRALKNERRLRTGIGIPVLILLMLASTATAQEPQQSALILRLPDGVAPETATILYSAGDEAGQKRASITTRRGIFDYPILPLTFNVPTSSQPNPTDPTGELTAFLNDLELKVGEPHYLWLLIYIPGFRMVAATFGGDQLAEAADLFAPTLEPLETTRFEGRLVDSTGQPRANQVLFLGYPLGNEMRHLPGLDDGFVATEEIPIATFRTKSDGAFSVGSSCVCGKTRFSAAMESLFSDSFRVSYLQKTGSLRYSRGSTLRSSAFRNQQVCRRRRHCSWDVERPKSDGTFSC